MIKHLKIDGTVLINQLIVLLSFVFMFKESLAKAIFILIFVIWLFTVEFQAIKKILKNVTVISIVIYTILIGVSLLYTEVDTAFTINILNRLLIYLVLPIIVFATSIQERYIPYIIKSFLLSMVINEIISYGILFDFWLHLKQGYPVYFMHHVFYSIILSFTIMLMIYYFLTEENKVLKVVSLIFIVTMIGNLVISGGRSGQVVLSVTFFVVLLYLYKRRFKAIIAAFVFPVIFFALAYYTYPQFKNRVHKTINAVEYSLQGNYNTSFGTRIAGYVLVYDMFKNNSVIERLFGYGVGDAGAVKQQYAKQHFANTMKAQIFYRQMHSSYNDTILWIGLVGLLVLLVFLLSIFWIRTNDFQLQYIKIVLATTLLVGYLSDSTLTSQYVMWLTSIFLGILLSHERLQINSTEDTSTNTT